MTSTDKAILRLIDLLIFQKKVKNRKEFCQAVKIQESTPSKVQNGVLHFTVAQIQSICLAFDVNANWLFGMETNVFNDKNSIKIDDFLALKSNKIKA
jgi:hypothetical protein